MRAMSPQLNAAEWERAAHLSAPRCSASPYLLIAFRRENAKPQASISASSCKALTGATAVRIAALNFALEMGLCRIM